MQTSIQSLLLTGPNQLRIEDRPVPRAGPGEVVLRVAYAGICHTDLFTMAGEYTGMSYPTVLGHEFSAVVEESGAGVQHVKAGDRVTTMGFVFCGVCQACQEGVHVACERLKAMPRDLEGAFQEMLLMPAVAVFRIPDSLSLLEAALTEPTSCAYNAVEQADVKPGDRVAVIGLGPIGLLAVQVARLRHPSLLVAIGNRSRIRSELAARLGSSHAILASDTDPFEVVMDLTKGRGIDAAILCGGGEESWNLACKMLAIRGRLVMEAMPAHHDARWSIPVLDFTQKMTSYRGAGGFTGSQFRTSLDLLARSQIDVASLVTHKFPLDDYTEALELAANRRDIAIKVVFQIARDRSYPAGG